MESEVPTLYIYSRVSTIKQTLHNKTGLQRQNSNSIIEETIKKFPGYPVIKLNDAGLSAMKGDNIEKGELGKFIDLCRHGRIAPGSILAMEQLDRFTRLDLSIATNYMNCLLIEGICIYTWSDGAAYKKDDVYAAILAILQLKGANEYSKKLSSRVNGAAKVTIERINSGDRDIDGYCRAIKGFGTNKFWVDVSSGYVRPHPYYFPIIREMLEMVLNGDGYYKIKKYLDGKYTPPTKARNESKTGWGVGIVKYFLLDDALIGKKEVKVEDEQHLLDNYYPSVCSVEELIKARKIRHEQKCFKSPVKKHFGLITGMHIAKCGDCGSSIQVFKSKASSKYESLRYKCSGRTDGSAHTCKCSTIDSRYLEMVLVKLIGSLVYQKKPEVDSTKIYELENELKSKTKEKDNLVNALAETGIARKYVIERLKKTAEEIELLNGKLKEERKFEFVAIDKSIFLNVPSHIIDYRKNEIRNEFRDKLNDCVDLIEINAIKNCFMVDVLLVDGARRRGILLDLKYYFDLGFDDVHKLDDSDEFLSYVKMQNNWYGIDKHECKIDIKDIYWNEISTVTEITDLLSLTTESIKQSYTESLTSSLMKVLDSLLNMVKIHTVKQ